MRITFIGTSDGSPRRGRRCSGLLVEIGEEKYIIDAGASIADFLADKGYTTSQFSVIKAVFVSHFHADHIFGGLEYMAIRNRCSLSRPLEVYIPGEKEAEAVRNIIGMTERPYNEDNLIVRSFDENFVYSDENITIVPIKNSHLPEPRLSFCFLICAEGKRILYSGDMSTTLDDLPDVLFREDVDLLIEEGAHQQLDTIRDKLKNISAKKVLFTHVNNEQKIESIKELFPLFPFDAGIAYDGMIVDF